MPRRKSLRNNPPREHELPSILHLSLKLRGGAQLGKAVKGRSKDGKGKKDGGRETTEEERRLQESIRRMEMNDYLKRLTVSKKALLQEFMAKEEKISRMNKLKIQNHWRKIMRLVKVEALRKEVEVRSQNHERDVDRKDALIQMLDRDLEEAEEQFQMALRAHLLNVDELIDLQDERLLGLEKEFETDLTELEQEFQTEKNKLITQHTMERNELQRIMQAVDQQEKEREADAKQEHEQLREEIRNKNLEDINVLRITLDSSIEELEQHFETAHLNYLQNTDQRTQDFKYLTAKDQDLSRDIELKIRKIERLQQSLALWRTKIAQNVRECSERNKALEEEKAAISHHFQTLKAKMNRMREDQRRRLTDLSQGAREATKKLDAHLQLSERILQLGELVRKLETERERVLPFYHSTLADEHEANELTETVRLAMRTETGREDEDAQQMLDFQSQGLQSGVPVSEWEYLDLFWKRHNKVLLDELALRREKERVANENRELQTILQQYLAGISVSPTVLDGANPLLVINGRLRLHQRAISEDGRPRPKPVIDANHMVDTNRVTRFKAAREI
ncbi:Coiled-coil domain-containing protein 65 [Phytophthora cactorum]|uniref:Dynein regulatory complex subunit 2 n=1 Tax=Phytophthora cactorum TaxID=29920 RepID=A0A8T0YHE8_9STRA|nr:Coiled-coil domain-containing protein 65 [Phytophthora cactorum]KAG2799558.1 Coiled-coil domain-containing protein 65 [Phytophthora cactorum]KAG2835546.1 Coiled-coil domain-containing protein 65 [Phytophthora cactorum]KAG2846323.1 Coiled-coil domain-containing protein 65 [Phytophthora cactorum]KAG2885369.1 Coiled-coil domain-containing protein 65 [Phytophthora cactorum]